MVDKLLHQESEDIRIVVLIPAHNEAGSIMESVRSIFAQSVFGLPNVNVDILVIADNCTDSTSEIVRSMQPEFPNLFLLKTVENKHRKAGALNQGFDWAEEHGKLYTHIFSMDADTVLDRYCLENGLREIKEQDGGVCCRVGLLPLEPEHFEPKPFTGQVATWFWIWGVFQIVIGKNLWMFKASWKRIWWSFQNLEYSFAQSEIVERFGRAHCLCGPGTLFRFSVLQELLRRNGEIWRGYSLVEDKYLTTEILLAGYKTRVGHNMFAYTDCPVGFKPHWLQRVRWNGGNLQTYFVIGLNRHTMSETLVMGCQFLWFCCRISLILNFIHILLTGFVYIDQFSFELMVEIGRAS